MLTYSLQWLIVLLCLAFALAALQVARATERAAAVQALAWRLAGVTFLLHAASQAVQVGWGGLVLWTGSRPAMLDSYLRWSPAFNHSRTAMLIVYCTVLAWHALRGTEWGLAQWLRYGLAVAAAALAGAAAGLLEGRLEGWFHFPVLAGADTLELVVLLGALFVGVTTDRLDRLLWGGLALYAFSVALSILWFAALTYVDSPGAWTPPRWALAAQRAVAMGGTLGLALWRLHRARHGLPVPGMMPVRHPTRTGLAG